MYLIFLWKCNDNVIIVRVFYRLSVEFLRLMHFLEFQDLLGFFNKQFPCSTSTLIHIKKSIEPQITVKNGILVSLSIVGTFFFSTIVVILWFQVVLIIQQFTSCFNTLFFNYCGIQARLPGVAQCHFLGSINSIERRFRRVTKSFKKLEKKCSIIGFFKLAHSQKKSMACVNIAQWQSSISSFGMFIIFLNNVRLSLSIFTFAHCHVPHSFVLSKKIPF